MRIVSRHCTSQLAYVILAIPLIILFPQIIANRLESANHVRLYVSAYVVISCINTTQTHFHSHAFHHAIINRHPVHILIAVVLILRVTHNGIVAECVVRVQKVHKPLCILAYFCRVLIVRSLNNLRYFWLRLRCHRLIANRQGYCLGIIVGLSVERHAETAAHRGRLLTDWLCNQALIDSHGQLMPLFTDCIRLFFAIDSASVSFGDFYKYYHLIACSTNECSKSVMKNLCCLFYRLDFCRLFQAFD